MYSKSTTNLRLIAQMEFEFNSRDRRGHHDTVRPIVFHASRAAEAGGHTPRTTVSPRI